MFGKKMTKEFHVEGMTCEGCMNRVKKAVSMVPNVTAVDVVLETGLVTVHYRKSLDEDMVISKIENLDFQVKR